MKNGKMFEYFSRGKGIALIEGRRRCVGRVLLEIPVRGALPHLVAAERPPMLSAGSLEMKKLEGNSTHCQRLPKMAVPIRTIVAPSAIASGKS